MFVIKKDLFSLHPPLIEQIDHMGIAAQPIGLFVHPVGESVASPFDMLIGTNDFEVDIPDRPVLFRTIVRIEIDDKLSGVNTALPLLGMGISFENRPMLRLSMTKPIGTDFQSFSRQEYQWKENYRYNFSYHPSNFL